MPLSCCGAWRWRQDTTNTITDNLYLIFFTMHGYSISIWYITNTAVWKNPLPCGWVWYSLRDVSVCVFIFNCHLDFFSDFFRKTQEEEKQVETITWGESWVVLLRARNLSPWSWWVPSNSADTDSVNLGLKKE